MVVGVGVEPTSLDYESITLILRSLQTSCEQGVFLVCYPFTPSHRELRMQISFVGVQSLHPFDHKIRFLF